MWVSLLAGSIVAVTMRQLGAKRPRPLSVTGLLPATCAL